MMSYYKTQFLKWQLFSYRFSDVYKRQVVDIGGGTTDVAVTALGGVVALSLIHI